MFGVTRNRLGIRIGNMHCTAITLLRLLFALLVFIECPDNRARVNQADDRRQFFFLLTLPLYVAKLVLQDLLLLFGRLFDH